jgi:hypothetical protein
MDDDEIILVICFVILLCILVPLWRAMRHEQRARFAPEDEEREKTKEEHDDLC